MASKQDKLNVSPGMVRRLMRENNRMGRQLAEHEMRRMLGELSNETLFGLELDFPGETPAEPPILPSIVDDPVARRLPKINVTTGTIVWSTNPADLPPLGILIPDCPPEELRTALRALMLAHSTEPFARFVFLCETFRPIPFLGRYKFVYEYIGKAKLDKVAERAALRYGINEVRSVIGTKLVWEARS